MDVDTDVGLSVDVETAAGIGADKGAFSLLAEKFKESEYRNKTSTVTMAVMIAFLMMGFIQAYGSALSPAPSGKKPMFSSALIEIDAIQAVLASRIHARISQNAYDIALFPSDLYEETAVAEFSGLHAIYMHGFRKRVHTRRWYADRSGILTPDRVTITRDALKRALSSQTCLPQLFRRKPVLTWRQLLYSSCSSGPVNYFF